MSFLGRLGLKSVSATEPNHGSVVEPSVEPSNALSNEIESPVDGAVESPVTKIQQKRFSIFDLGFKDNGEDYPKSLELIGVTLTSEMFIVFPGHTLWLSTDDKSEVLLQLFSSADRVKPIAMIWAMYLIAMVPDDRVKSCEGHLIFPPGTYLCKPDGDDYGAEFNLLN